MNKHTIALLLGCALNPAFADSRLSFEVEKPLIHQHNAEHPIAAIDEYPSRPEQFYSRNIAGYKAIAEGQYQHALSIFKQSTEEFGDDGDLWRARALCEEQTGSTESAIASYQKALALGVTPWDTPLPHLDNPNDIEMQIARLYSKSGNKAEALKWLRKSLYARFDERPTIMDNPAFEAIRNDGEFRELFALDSAEQIPRNDGWLADINFLRREIAALHANPDYRRSATQLQSDVEALIKEIPELSDEQIMARMVALVGSLGAGHDIFWPVFPKHGAMKPFALKFYLFSDGLFIIDAYDPALIGAKVLAFNGTSAREAYTKVQRAFAGDNEMQARWQAARHLAQAYTLENLGIVDDARDVRLHILDTKGEERSFAPERRAFTSFTPALTTPLNGKSAPLYLSQLGQHGKNAWLKELPEIKSLYVQILAVQNSENETLAEFSERIAQESRKPSIENIVLDLRHSPGGNGYLTPPLLRTLIAFSVNPEKRNLFVIIGRNTFSASQNLITDLDWIADPIFVGEPSGSSPNAYSESGQTKLPYSGATLILSSQLHQHSWPEDERYWIAPDIPVALSSKDFFEGHDPSMAAIKNFIKHSTTNE